MDSRVFVSCCCSMHKRKDFVTITVKPTNEMHIHTAAPSTIKITVTWN